MIARVATIVTALAVVSIVAGCSEEPPPAAIKPARQTPAAASPTSGIPTQDQADNAAAARIGQENADEALRDLERDVDEEYGGDSN